MSSDRAILIISPFFSPNIGGVENYLDDLVEALQKRKWKLFVITYCPLTSSFRTPFYEKLERVEIFRLPWIRFNLFYRLEKYPSLQFLYLFLGIFIFSFFYTLIFSRKFYVIHGHGLAAGLAASIIGKCFLKKSVISLHTIYKFQKKSFQGKIAKAILSKADIITVLSKRCQESLFFLGIEQKKIKVCSYWVDSKRTFIMRDKTEMRKKMKINQDWFLVLFVGRLTREKGVREVLKIAQQAQQDIQFFIIGDGPLRREVERVTARCNNLHFLGSLSKKELAHWFAVANVLLWGSVDQDYVGRVTMQSLSCGLPVILPNRTKYFEQEREVTQYIKEQDKKIWFVLSPNIKQMLHFIEKLKEKADVLEEMRFRCRQFVLEHCSEEKKIGAIIDVYQNFIFLKDENLC